MLWVKGEEMNIFDDYDAELLKQFKSITEEQRLEEDRLRKIQREWDAKHTSIETDADRADTEEYPVEDDV
jgi:hypothetical protein